MMNRIGRGAMHDDYYPLASVWCTVGRKPAQYWTPRHEPVTSKYSSWQCYTLCFKKTSVFNCSIKTKF